MGPLPKKRHSISRRNKRRSHDGLTLKQLDRCENCGSYRLAHHVCPNCGQYRGRQVVDVTSEK
ncbi:MAG: 50S ribosomal protein L32 [Anaerolineae bacterium]|nr:50S ribosomal protein L32 [Anaerolineae bacterium]